MSASTTASGSAPAPKGDPTMIEKATAAAGAMCVMDWNRTSRSPIASRASSVDGCKVAHLLERVRYTPVQAHDARVSRRCHKTSRGASSTRNARKWYLPSTGSSQVLDRHGFDLVGEVEAEDAAVEEQLGLEGAADALGPAEAVLLALEGQVGVGDALQVEGARHLLGLAGRHHGVLQALQQDHRAGELVGVVDRRALPVQLRGLRIGTDQAVEVARLELVGVPGERLDVSHAEVARAGREGVVEGERA